MKSLLFLCTGNYYRSRFAEELFNHHTEQEGLSWIAQSRALAIERGINNIGALSPFVIKALGERNLVVRGANRLPLQCTVADLEIADWIVALKEPEHRPLIQERFPGWESRPEYWQIDDVDVASPAIALDSIEREIEALIGRLRAFQ